MDALLSRLGVQALNYAIRSGLALTSTYAISQCSRLLKTVDNHVVYKELRSLQKLLDSKIKIVSPAIDLIEFKSGRGNVFLESAVPLAKSLHRDILSLGRLLETAANQQENICTAHGRSGDDDARLQGIVKELQSLLDRIDRDIPLLQLAITASGESLSTSLPPGVSPSRLLQASTLLILGDTQFAESQSPVQIGPCFTLSIYMLFLGHASACGLSKEQAHVRLDAKQTGELPPTPRTPVKHESGQAEIDYTQQEGGGKPVWQEVIHKARVRLCRTPAEFRFDEVSGYRQAAPSTDFEADGHYPAPTNEYNYHLEFIENLDDGRNHDGKMEGRYDDDVLRAGIRESMPLHQISKIFYADTGRILNIKDGMDPDNSPVLLIKRDMYIVPPGGVGVWPKEHSPSQQYTSPDDRPSEFEEGDLDQVWIDRQLEDGFREERNRGLGVNTEGANVPGHEWRLPSHLDPEWMALEVFEDDDSETDSDTEEPDLSGTDADSRTPHKPHAHRARQSLDPTLISKLRNLSTQEPPTPGPANLEDGASCRSSHGTGPHQGRSTQETEAQTTSFVARSPFGEVVSSLSLLEMLIRLASLQEFQQMSHLAIPDHILTFFLEETSTTGLTGEEKWKLRAETKRKVGFDPYTDSTPSQKRSE